MLKLQWLQPTTQSVFRYINTAVESLAEGHRGVRESEDTSMGEDGGESQANWGALLAILEPAVFPKAIPEMN